jgi:hypothetical protein
VIPENSAANARRTIPAITVLSIATELHALYPQALPNLQQATVLVQKSLANQGYSNMEPEDAVWSSNRTRILEAFREYHDEQQL